MLSRLDTSPRILFACSAGAAFLASLGYFAWTYVVRFDRMRVPPGTSPLSAVLLDAALFGLFAAHHSLLARPSVKKKLTSLFPDSVERPMYVWVASALFVIVCWQWRPVPGLLYLHAGIAATAHRVLQGAGVLIIVAAVRVLDPFELAGITPTRNHEPHENAGTDKPSTVSNDGPYRIVRHPIYLGWVLFVFATPHLTATRLSFAAISTGYLLVAMPWEERALLRMLGAPYGRYLSRTRWRLLPGVY